MILNPEAVNDAKARMRLATTRACVNFPQLNMTPVHLAFYQVYADVAYFIGSTFVLHDDGVAKEIRTLVLHAQVDLLNKKSNDLVLMGMTQQEAKKIRGLTLGMTPEMARVMVDLYRNSSRASDLQIKRSTLLTTRRNLLANEWTEKAIAAAYERFKTAERGDGIAQSSAFRSPRDPGS